MKHTATTDNKKIVLNVDSYLTQKTNERSFGVSLVDRVTKI